MKVVPLYRYSRPDGGVSTSPIEPAAGVDYTMRYRLIADDGKEVYNGTIRGECVDTDTLDGWTEVEAIGDMSENEAYAEAGKILMGVSE